ncbi:MAG: hypothetical protein AAFN70_16785, partial [Planctomycetota bacterium]
LTAARVTTGVSITESAVIGDEGRINAIAFSAEERLRELFAPFEDLIEIGNNVQPGENTVSLNWFSNSIVVNDVGDAGDDSGNDGKCDTGATKPIEGREVAVCTLRAAIEEANARAGDDVIQFAIPDANDTQYAATVQQSQPSRLIIDVNQALPEIQSTVTIDASTQPNYRFGQNMVQLHGGTQLQNTDGMVIRAADSVVRGLAIAGIPGDGIVIRGNESTGNRIESNVIGLTAALQRNIESSNGTPRRAGNHRSGVLLADGASKNFVGTNMDGANDTGEANIITGNYLNGISIVGGSNDNTIAANQIGRGDIGNGFSLATSDVFEPTIDVLSNQPAQVRDASLSFSAAGRRADWTGQSVTFTSGILASIPLRIESDDSDDGEIFVEARQFTFPEGNAFDARLGQHIGVVGGNGVY